MRTQESGNATCRVLPVNKLLALATPALAIFATALNNIARKLGETIS